jgi:hypothetical protein
MGMIVIMLSLILFILMVLLLLQPVNILSATTENYSNITKSIALTNFDVSGLGYSISSNPFNTSYSDWTAKWWQWAYSIPWSEHPSYDNTGIFCSENQNEPVWYLSNSFEYPAVRTCELPLGTALLIALLNSECSFAEFPTLKTEQELQDCAESMQDIVDGGHAFLNEENISSLIEYRVQTGIFNFTLPQNNILNLTSQTTQAVADGNWLFLKPLPPGTHKLEIKGDINSTALKSPAQLSKGDQYSGPVGWNQTTTYILKVK